jgi:chemotaxis signal transduction protein
VVIAPEVARAASLLDRRTVALATRTSPGARQTVHTRLAWSAAGSLFGIDVAAVAAVIPYAGCARVPTREPACIGIIGRAGRFYSVICMRRLFGLPPAAAAEVEADAEVKAGGQPGHLLLLRGGAPYLALAVDRVLGRFDVAGDGSATAAFDGRLVAPFDAAELLSRLGRS